MRRFQAIEDQVVERQEEDKKSVTFAEAAAAASDAMQEYIGNP